MRYAWRGKKTAYKDIGDALGVVFAKDTDTGLMYGANSPRPAEVRIGYTDASGNSKSVVRFCEPDKIGDVTTGGKLNGKKITIGSTQYNISGCTIKTN
ncbi:hypothetical protein [uncultured Nostoc sp.]|uniref:hypothetical protein n=1 Tax=uncultured Nostoc sp. TaxID=340711 RepID=UPI0035CC9E2A